MKSYTEKRQSDKRTMLSISITSLRHSGDKVLENLNRDKQPVLITRYGLPKGYLIDKETFELRQQRIKDLERMIKGEREPENPKPR